MMRQIRPVSGFYRVQMMLKSKDIDVFFFEFGVRRALCTTERRKRANESCIISEKERTWQRRDCSRL